MPTRATVVTATFPAPWGPLHAAASDRGAVAAMLLATREAFLADVGRTWDVGALRGATPAAGAWLDRLEAWFAAYFEGRAAIEMPVDLHVGSDWDARVLDGVRSIQAGEVDTYGGVARRIGRVGAARAVGGAVGRNPLAILVPCHRVIAAGGRIGGYGGDWYGSREDRLAIKRDLLRLEGVVLPDDRFAA